MVVDLESPSGLGFDFVNGQGLQDHTVLHGPGSANLRSHTMCHCRDPQRRVTDYHDISGYGREVMWRRRGYLQGEGLVFHRIVVRRRTGSFVDVVRARDECENQS